MIKYGPILCTKCRALFKNHTQPDNFEVWGDGERIRLINNPCSWGSSDPKVIILGFSKGDTQNKELERFNNGIAAFDKVPFQGMRDRLACLLNKLGLLDCNTAIDDIFLDVEPIFQSGSIIRCSISVRDEDGKYSFKMKDILSNPDVKKIMWNCIRTHLGQLKIGTILLLLGLDEDYINECKNVFDAIHSNVQFTSLNTYSNNEILCLHITHLTRVITDNQFQNWLNGTGIHPKIINVKNELGRWRQIFPEYQYRISSALTNCPSQLPKSIS
jgi:hypothetical protein